MKENPEAMKKCEYLKQERRIYSSSFTQTFPVTRAQLSELTTLVSIMAMKTKTAKTSISKKMLSQERNKTKDYRERIDCFLTRNAEEHDNFFCINEINKRIVEDEYNKNFYL